MRTARWISAVVVFFLLFGLPTMIFIQFGRMQHGGGDAVEGEGALASILRKFLPRSGKSAAGSRTKGRPGRGAPGTAQTGSAGGADASTLPASGGTPEEPSASGGGYFGDEGRPIIAGRPDNGGMEELEGGPISEGRAGGSGRFSSGGQPLVSGGAGAKDGDGAGDPRERRMRSTTGNSSKALEDSERSAAAKHERAQTARVELTTDLSTGENQANLVKTTVESNQAVNMAKKLHLLDGAKDHAGRQFDGNTKFRSAIPLEKYTDSFGNQAVRAKGESVDLSP